MALVNIGVQLAQSGKKVLLVDFDLEAPGLQTFNLAKSNGSFPGIVDFVTKYVATGESPDVRQHVYESNRFDGGGALWVMPVGQQDASYSSRLNSIDWQSLYAEQDGYLLFEDLKRQWDSALAMDYVLIDSRTGHSDVEGICTRQLPNSVCLLFFPNEQNLQGLTRIVANIRAENDRIIERTGRAEIALHFVVSNVPDLDDENLILETRMTSFREELGYSKLSAEIHHYNSLSLLNQEIFSIARPNSRLTREYRTLLRAITRGNLGDRGAVLDFLNSAHRELGDLLADIGAEELHKRVGIILKNFGQDGEVCFRVALVYLQMGKVRDADSLLKSDAVEKTHATAEMFASRAKLSHLLGNKLEVAQNLESMLSVTGADLESLLEVVPLIEQTSPDLFEKLPTSKAFKSLSRNDKLNAALQFEASGHQLNARLAILKQLRKENKISRKGNATPFDDRLEHGLKMSSVAVGEFDTTVQILGRDDGKIKEMVISDAFNLGMTLWGKFGNPRSDIFEHVASLDDLEQNYKIRDSNYMQCLAITHAVLGNVEKAHFFLSEAKKSLEAQPRREFSAWTYTRVDPEEFFSHLDEINRLAAGENIVPRFMRIGQSDQKKPT